MLRSTKLRGYIKEIAESQTFEKLSFIPPFLILLVELILLIHAIEIQVLYVIELTIILVALSIIELFFVMGEIHEHYKDTNFDRILTIKLDDFILSKKQKNVQKLVTMFLKAHPEYCPHRNKTYHIACQILETHEEEVFEHNMDKDLKKYLRTTEYQSVDSILNTFLEKYPQYKTNPAKIYRQICEHLEKK